MIKLNNFNLFPQIIIFRQKKHFPPSKIPNKKFARTHNRSPLYLSSWTTTRSGAWTRPACPTCRSWSRSPSTRTTSPPCPATWWPGCPGFYFWTIKFSLQKVFSSRLQSLRLEHNQLSCDCRLSWVLDHETLAPLARCLLVTLFFWINSHEESVVILALLGSLQLHLEKISNNWNIKVLAPESPS